MPTYLLPSTETGSQKVPDINGNAKVVKPGESIQTFATLGSPFTKTSDGVTETPIATGTSITSDDSQDTGDSPVDISVSRTVIKHQFSLSCVDSGGTEKKPVGNKINISIFGLDVVGYVPVASAALSSAKTAEVLFVDGKFSGFKYAIKGCGDEDYVRCKWQQVT